MPQTRVRLADSQVAALARSAFGLVPGPPDLPPAAEYEDAQGVLLATRGAGGLTVLDVPRWPSPERVRRRPGGPLPVWVGRPPADPSGLPGQLLALLPSAGLAGDAATVAAAAAPWAAVRSGGRRVDVVPVPVTPTAPELPWADVAGAYGSTLLGADVGAVPVVTGGAVVLFTGLSGSGKSTVAARLVELLQEAGRTVTLLDGDEVRTHLSAGLGFSRADRDTNVRRIGWVAARIAKHGGVAVCAPIAPYAQVRADVRDEVEAQAGPGSFVLVHLATPLAECESRDRKGLYARARRGELAAFTGVSDPYEEPADAQVRIDTTGRDVDACAREVLGAVPGAEVPDQGPAGRGRAG